MTIPSNMTEEQVLQTINNIANRLAAKFKFGYHELEDMKLQARLFEWQGLKNYDGVRPLENFLWTHVRNRLYNFFHSWSLLYVSRYIILYTKWPL